ncbi:porin [Thalassospira povalilytica]|uniref:porin n=1 Tax=Thalassospira povalilytica TaxID=732237 RepID=UPI001D192D17|nr:porin [Thalassospira povalilytica]MCC4239908.1 porin [Thalassospira povalilytica]MEE3045558.1 porin [Pseudomonadota bacterium]
MKKILVASSALVAVAFAGQAQASEKISLSVSGYMEQWIGGVSQDSKFEAPGAMYSDTEVHFKGSTTLDNGIEVGAAIEFEAEGEYNNNTDEQYLYINGGFGQVKLGQEDGAAADMTITAPNVGPAGVNDGDMPNLATLNKTPDNAWDDGDDNKLTYYTPSLGGFRAGVSYTDDDGSEASDENVNNEGDSVVSAGVEYKGDFDGVSIAVAASGESKGEGEWYHVGGTVGFGAFTVGASYGVREAEFGKGENVVTTEDDDMGVDFGVSYAMDAATVSATYMYAEMEDGTATTGQDEFNGVDLGLAYTLGAGVTWKSSVFWFDYDGASTANDNDGFGAVTGLVLSF